LTAATVAVLDSFAGDADDWQYGYDLLATSGLKSGSLYPILMRLADRGYLEARWDEPAAPGRPRRHMYRLTPAGRELVRQVMPAPGGRRRLRPQAAQ
jgi:DNA-binding PadR family transcriptional regulator